MFFNAENSVEQLFLITGDSSTHRDDPRHRSVSAAVFPLCIEGKELSSPQFAEKIEGVSLSGKSKICFIIGSSFGLSERVKERADFKLSFSKMTFPHQLFRVLLLEQLYRAFSITNKMKYHK